MSETVDSWVGLSGSFDDPANWSGGVPGTASDATLPGTSAYTVLFDTDAVVGGLDGTDALATLEMSGGSLDIAAGGTFAGVLALDGGTFAVGNNHTQYLTLSGTVDLDGKLVAPGFLTEDILYLTGSTDFDGLTDSDITLYVNGPASLSGDITLRSFLNIGDAAVFSWAGDAAIGGGGIAAATMC